MDFGSGRAIEIAPFHSRGSLKGFVVSGRWPDSTKEWAQLLMVAVRVASMPGLLSTTTIFGAREELPDEPEALFHHGDLFRRLLDEVGA